MEDSSRLVEDGPERPARPTTQPPHLPLPEQTITIQTMDTLLPRSFFTGPWTPPPPLPQPGEPGFAPLPDYRPTLQQHIAGLRAVLDHEESKRHKSNLLALIHDLETTGSSSDYYQNGQGISRENLDLEKGPAMPGFRGIGRQLVASAAIFPNDGVRTGNFACGGYKP